MCLVFKAQFAHPGGSAYSVLVQRRVPGGLGATSYTLVQQRPSTMIHIQSGLPNGLSEGAASPVLNVSIHSPVASADQASLPASAPRSHLGSPTQSLHSGDLRFGADSNSHPAVQQPPHALQVMSTPDIGRGAAIDSMYGPTTFKRDPGVASHALTLERPGQGGRSYSPPPATLNGRRMPSAITQLAVATAPSLLGGKTLVQHSKNHTTRHGFLDGKVAGLEACPTLEEAMME